MAKKFKDIIEVLNDPNTRKFILEEIQNAFKKKGAMYENPLGKLQEKGLLTLPEICYEFIRIKNKSSELPFHERAIVDLVVRKAIRRTIKHYKLS